MFQANFQLRSTPPPYVYRGGYRRQVPLHSSSSSALACEISSTMEVTSLPHSQDRTLRVQHKAPIRSLTAGLAMLGNVSSQSTGQREGNPAGQSQHESDWADVQEDSELSIPTIGASAHAGLRVVGSIEALPVVTTVLTALIGMHDDACLRFAPPERHKQGIQSQLTGQRRFHRPANHLACVQIYLYRQIQPALPGANVGVAACNRKPAGSQSARFWAQIICD